MAITHHSILYNYFEEKCSVLDTAQITKSSVIIEDIDAYYSRDEMKINYIWNVESVISIRNVFKVIEIMNKVTIM